MVASRGILKLWKYAQQNEPQSSLLPEAAWYGVCFVIWLVFGGGSLGSNSLQYFLETDQVQTISNPDNPLHINCIRLWLCESLIEREGCWENKIDTRNRRRAALIYQVDLPDIANLLSINSGVVKQSFIKLCWVDSVTHLITTLVSIFPCEL